MAKKADIKICRYDKCEHPEKKVNIAEEEFVANGRKYYHSECWAKFEKEEQAENKLKADIQLIKNMWIENISSTVVISQLYLEINKLVRDRKIDSEYIIFVLDYCIKNKCKLRYPGGLKYYVDKQEIRDAYTRNNARKVIANADFSVKENNEDDTPKFSVNRKPTGFNSILSSRKY